MFRLPQGSGPDLRLVNMLLTGEEREELKRGRSYSFHPYWSLPGKAGPRSAGWALKAANTAPGEN